MAVYVQRNHEFLAFTRQATVCRPRPGAGEIGNDAARFTRWHSWRLHARLQSVAPVRGLRKIFA